MRQTSATYVLYIVQYKVGIFIELVMIGVKKS